MLATVPRFTPAAAYRCGVLDGRHCAQAGGPVGLVRRALVRGGLLLLRPAWRHQEQRVRLAWKWGFEHGYRGVVATARPDLVA